MAYKNESYFDKSLFGGYNAEQVDEFVQEARQLIAQYKEENETLRQKCQILADTVADYRENGTLADAADDAATDAAEDDFQLVLDDPAFWESVADGEAAEETEHAPEGADAAPLPFTEPEAAEDTAEETMTAAEDTAEAMDPVGAEGAAAETLAPDDVPEAEQIEAVRAEYRALRDACIEAKKDYETLRVQHMNFCKEIAAQYRDQISALLDFERELEEDRVHAQAQTAEAPPHAADWPAYDTVVKKTVLEENGQEEEPFDFVTLFDTMLDEIPEPADTQPAAAAADTIGAGESVFLNAGDLSEMSYEEALDAILRRNGIQSTQAQPVRAEASAAVQSEREAVRQPQSARQAQPVRQKAGLFTVIKKSINRFLEDDGDLDVSIPTRPAPVRQSNQEETELQFGKAYDVTKDQ